jgi:RHS repeat-associated protein
VNLILLNWWKINISIINLRPHSFLPFHFSYFWLMNTNGPGNVLTTISDRKKRLAGTTPAFEAVIETAQDYYPFGSLMPGRKYNAGEYRFGFQGQEKDDEITGVTGSHVSFKYRIHDARLGRFLSVDPLTKDYPFQSPYVFSENRVIDGVELEGAERLDFRTHMAAASASGNPATGLVTYAADWATDWGGRDIKAGLEMHAKAVVQHQTENGYTEHVPAEIQKRQYENKLAEADKRLMTGVGKFATKVHTGMGLAMAGVEGTYGSLFNNITKNAVVESSNEITSGVTRSLDDLNSMKGAKWSEAEDIIPKDWIQGPLNKGEGIKYVNPNKNGEQILLEKGIPGAKDPLHSGPYMKVSRNGEVTRIPLEGNPVLDK